MITEVIKINADTSDANSKIDKLDSSLSNLNSTNAGVAKGMKESTSSVLENGVAMGLLNDLTGGLAMTVKDAVEATALFAKESKIATFVQGLYSTVVGTSTGAMKLFRIALASTGIGLIVIALGLLVANFSKVTDAVTKFLPGLKAVGDFFTNVVNAVTDFIGVTSEAERELERFNERAKESLAQNEKFIAQRGDLLDKFSTKKVEAKNKYLKAVQEENLSDLDRLELAKRLNRDLANIDIERADEKAKNKKAEQDKLDAIQKKIDDDAKAKQDKLNAEAKKREEERISKFNEDRKKTSEESAKFQDEIETINIERQVREEKAKDDFLITDLERRQRGSEAIKLANEKEAQDALILEENVKNAKLNIANQTLALIGEIAGRGSKIGKATAVAQATISGYEGVQNAFATANKSPITAAFPAYPYIQAGLAGAFSALQIRNILKTNTSGSGGSSFSQSGGAGGGGAPSAPSFNLVQGTGANQIASSIAGQNRPIEAYVVSSNVTTAQGLDRNIIENSKI